LSLYYY